MKPLHSSLSLGKTVLLFVFPFVTILSLFNNNIDVVAQEKNTNIIDAAKCRDLGFASPHSSALPVCGTCDVLADLLKATPEEKQLSEETRLTNKNMKKQLMSECRSCCVSGSFEDDADKLNNNNLHQQNQQASSSSGGGGFVSVVIEVDKSVAENPATSINRFIRRHSAEWNSEKISVQYTELMAPRLLVKRTNGKVDIVNVGSWEPELIYEYLRKELIA